MSQPVKKTIEETKKNFKQIGDAIQDVGKNLVSNVVDIAKEAQEQWKVLTDGQATNADKFAASWASGSHKAASIVQKNYLAAVSGIKDGNDEIVESSDETTETIIKNEEDVTETIAKEVENRKSFYNGWSEFVEENLKTNLDKFSFWADRVLNLMGTMFSGISDISSMAFQNEQDKNYPR